jgi:hypothetical protein
MAHRHMLLLQRAIQFGPNSLGMRQQAQMVHKECSRFYCESEVKDPSRSTPDCNSYS